jgi:hypothetical protein
VAQKLHDTYGFSYDNLKVLLGGWNSWLQQNSANPTAYPIIVNSTPATGGAAPTSASGAPVVTTTIVIKP